MSRQQNNFHTKLVKMVKQKFDYSNADSPSSFCESQLLPDFFIGLSPATHSIQTASHIRVLGFTRFHPPTIYIILREWPNWSHCLTAFNKISSCCYYFHSKAQWGIVTRYLCHCRNIASPVFCVESLTSWAERRLWLCEPLFTCRQLQLKHIASHKWMQPLLLIPVWKMHEVRM